MHQALHNAIHRNYSKILQVDQDLQRGFQGWFPGGSAARSFYYALPEWGNGDALSKNYVFFYLLCGYIELYTNIHDIDPLCSFHGNDQLSFSRSVSFFRMFTEAGWILMEHFIKEETRRDDCLPVTFQKGNQQILIVGRCAIIGFQKYLRAWATDRRLGICVKTITSMWRAADTAWWVSIG